MNLLKQLELDELSLVDRPANASAKVALFKRDTSDEDIMTEETEKAEGCPDCTTEKMCATHAEEYGMKKSEDPDETEVPSEEQPAEGEEISTLKAENERLRKSLIENGFVIKADVIEKKDTTDTIEVEGEMVAKSDIPAPVLKALEAARIEKKMIELRKRAESELPHFDTEVAMTLLEKFDAADEKIMEALKGADAAFAASMDEVGEKAVDADMLDPQSKLDKMVEEHAATHGVNKYAAFDAVAKTAEGKALIAKTYEKDE